VSGPGRRLRAACAGDDGSVTVEAAIGLASVVTVVVLSATAAGAALVQVRLVDAAREAARVAASAGTGDGVAAGRASAPAGARVAVSGGAEVTAVVEAAAPGVPGVELRARAVARAEPGADTGTGVGGGRP